MHTRGLVALCLTFALGCGGGTSPAEPESSSGEERVVVEKPGDHEAQEADEAAPAHTTNKHALDEEASETLHQAEWLREEQSRMKRQLDAQLGRKDVSCASVRETRDEVCFVSERICALVADDSDVASRCEESRATCDGAKAHVAGSRCK